MHIEIHLPRPGVTLLAVSALLGWGLYLSSPEATQATVIEAPAVRVSDEVAANVPAPAAPSTGMAIAEQAAQTNTESPLTQAEIRMMRARAEQVVLSKRENILRQQLAALQRERESLGATVDPGVEEQFRRSVKLLTSLLQDRKRAEDVLRLYYRQELEAEQRAMTAAEGASRGAVALLWPVDPSRGISAGFLDEGYEREIGGRHYAADVLALQGSIVTAAADGDVVHVTDNGLGYTNVIIDHGSYSTEYGHLSKIEMRVGQRVKAGERIGLSGGRPGEPGGGLSTGPHLHFALYVNGVPVDPLKYLPKI